MNIALKPLRNEGADPGGPQIATNDKQGDPRPLENKTAVTFPVAEGYLGISARQRQRLVKQGALVTAGKGTNRKITVESLLKYLPQK